jgi:hypothetical protein
MAPKPIRSGKAKIFKSPAKSRQIESFVLAPIFNTDYAVIKASINNRYVTAENGGAQSLAANRDEIGLWEKFTITKVSDCQTQ